ncbi:23S rRNA (adenine(1618)-N(6))-methyltransferase RlmF [Ichthyenterobacterium sp. W332]|uniref:Ribosomal RNA large subunit methyltransferase F n=1 Tax=Microcosmobacter mediterraneus TaxID=3075607 RepID=A0ABU2YHI1_9FLAO|nr:23S rRNA (adenine(1618)-N(6))-methyltransferase RlmF [Ichthyenterobacterium sp. W332]MDT0557629.1 23S rRNA (adenine(1618)-N(6))-methyltransferase RlmF [Ichthyenterobacterium sp. W332]
MKNKPKKPSLHPKNKHKFGYDFDELCKSYTKLTPFVFTNNFGNRSIDFSDPKAVKQFNTALLVKHYGITYWQFSDANLCPPIPGRADYIHHLNDLLVRSNLENTSTILDIGTGATCIYPLLGHAIYNWKFIATDISLEALSNSKLIIAKNGFEEAIQLRHQQNPSHILKSILLPDEKISASMCNPPFFKSEKDAIDATKRKLKGLGKSGNFIRNFSGTSNELWYQGGEKAFLHNYLYESSLYKTQCFWFTSLVSNKDHIKSMQQSLIKLGATRVEEIAMSQGHKVSRIIAWTFLNDKEQKDWTT